MNPSRCASTYSFTAAPKYNLTRTNIGTFQNTHDFAIGQSYHSSPVKVPTNEPGISLQLSLQNLCLEVQEVDNPIAASYVIDLTDASPFAASFSCATTSAAGVISPSLLVATAAHLIVSLPSESVAVPSHQQQQKYHLDSSFSTRIKRLLRNTSFQETPIYSTI